MFRLRCPATETPLPGIGRGFGEPIVGAQVRPRHVRRQQREVEVVAAVQRQRVHFAGVTRDETSVRPASTSGAAVTTSTDSVMPGFSVDRNVNRLSDPERQIDVRRDEAGCVDRK